MKIVGLFFACILLVAGCHSSSGQLPTTPSSSCSPSTTPGTYTALTSTTYATALGTTTYTDATSVGKTVCYFAQTLDNLGGVSAPSNTVLISVPSTAKGTLLTWTPPTSCSGQCKYAVFSLPAIQTTPNAVTLAPATDALVNTPKVTDERTPILVASNK